MADTSEISQKLRKKNDQKWMKMIRNRLKRMETVKMAKTAKNDQLKVTSRQEAYGQQYPCPALYGFPVIVGL